MKRMDASICSNNESMLGIIILRNQSYMEYVNKIELKSNRHYQCGNLRRSRISYLKLFEKYTAPSW